MALKCTPPPTIVTRRKKRELNTTTERPKRPSEETRKRHLEPDSRSGQDKSERNDNIKKIILKPKHELKVAMDTNKRKRRTPCKVITINTSKEHEPNSLPLLSNTTQNAQLPTQSSGESQVLLLKDLRKSPLLLTGEDLIRIYADNMSEDLKKSPSSSNAEDLINMDEDSLSEDGFMKILTCPSPVWWEDSSDKFDAGLLSFTRTGNLNEKNEVIQETADTTSIIIPSSNNTDLKRTETVCETNKSKKMMKVISEDKELNNNESDVTKVRDGLIYYNCSGLDMSLIDEDLFKDVVDIDIHRENTTDQNDEQNSKHNDGDPEAVMKKDGYKISNVTNRTEDYDEINHNLKVMCKENELGNYESGATKVRDSPIYISSSGSDMSLNDENLLKELVVIDIQNNDTTNPEDFDKGISIKKENTRYSLLKCNNKKDPEIICIDDDDDYNLNAIEKTNEKLDSIFTDLQNADQEENLTISKDLEQHPPHAAQDHASTTRAIDKIKETRASVDKMTEPEQNSQPVIKQKAMWLRIPQKEQSNINSPPFVLIPIHLRKINMTTKENIPKTKSYFQHNVKGKTTVVIKGLKIIKEAKVPNTNTTNENIPKTKTIFQHNVKGKTTVVINGLKIKKEAKVTNTNTTKENIPKTKNLIKPNTQEKTTEEINSNKIIKESKVTNTNKTEENIPKTKNLINPNAEEKSTEEINGLNTIKEAQVINTNTTKENIPKIENLFQQMQQADEKSTVEIDGYKIIKENNKMRIEGLDITITDVRWCHHSLEPNKTHEVKNDLSITLIKKDNKCDKKIIKRI